MRYYKSEIVEILYKESFIRRIKRLIILDSISGEILLFTVDLRYRQPGWIGTDGVNRDAGLQPGELVCLSRLEHHVLIYPSSPEPPRLTVNKRKRRNTL